MSQTQRISRETSHVSREEDFANTRKPAPHTPSALSMSRARQKVVQFLAPGSSPQHPSFPLSHFLIASDRTPRPPTKTPGRASRIPRIIYFPTSHLRLSSRHGVIGIG